MLSYARCIFSHCSTHNRALPKHIFGITKAVHDYFHGNEVRSIVDQEGNPWFVARDVASLLDYADTDKAVRTHCKHAEILKPANSAGLTTSPRGINIIPESDFYRLIMRSSLPQAEEIQDWLAEEVLPTLRKTGKYESPKAIANSKPKEVADTQKVYRIEAEILRGDLWAVALCSSLWRLPKVRTLKKGKGYSFLGIWYFRVQSPHHLPTKVRTPRKQNLKHGKYVERTGSESTHYMSGKVRTPNRGNYETATV